MISMMTIDKHDEDNKVIIVKGPCSESVLYKEEERYQEFEWFCSP